MSKLKSEIDISLIDISLIRKDGGTQCREALSEEYARSLAESLSGGETLPPIQLYYDGAAYWIGDGFHRVWGHELAEKQQVNAVITPGTRRDAILCSVGANSEHGLRRTKADKRRAVQRLLNDEEWSKWSNRKIARICRVGHTLVDTLRNASARKGQMPRSRICERNDVVYEQALRSPVQPPPAEQPDPLVGAEISNEDYSSLTITEVKSNGLIFVVAGKVDEAEVVDYLRRSEFAVTKAAPPATQQVDEAIAPDEDLEAIAAAVPNDATPAALSIGGLYQHFKGGFYKVKCLAKHTETQEDLVIYCEGDRHWARPHDEFMSSVMTERGMQPRFALIDSGISESDAD